MSCQYRIAVKSQSAMEYLMTYGWAILVIAIVLGVLFAEGIFGSANGGTSVCLAQSGFMCQSPSLSSSGTLSFTFGQTTGQTITVTGIGCSSNSSPPTSSSGFSGALVSGGQVSTSAQCTLPSSAPIGTHFTGTLWIVYDTPTASGQVSEIGTISAYVTAFGLPTVLTVLASGQSDPTYLAVANGYVYWTDSAGGTIEEVPVGGGTITTLASGQSNPQGIFVTGSYVYWVDDSATGTINEVPVGGGSNTILASGQSDPFQIAVANGYVYWTDLGSGLPSTGTVEEVPVGGGSNIILAPGLSSPSFILATSSYVYWNSASSNIQAVPVGGGSITTFNPSIAINIEEIAIANGYIYYAAAGNSEICEIPVGGGSSTVLASGQSTPVGIAVANGYVYWTDEIATGTIEKVPVSGGSNTVLASGQDYPNMIAVVNGHVYWTIAQIPGNIMSIGA